MQGEVSTARIAPKVDDLRPLNDEELQEVWYAVCKTTLRRDLARNEHLPLQRLGCAIALVRKKRQVLTGHQAITHNQVEQWFKRNGQKVGDLNTVSDDNFGDVVKGKVVVTDRRRWEQIARSLLYFYLVGDRFEVPPLPDSERQEFQWEGEWAGRICRYFYRFFDPVDGDVASPTSLEEVINERERRTFGLKNEYLSAAHIGVSSGFMEFLEQDSGTGGANLGDASLDFLRVGGHLTLICPDQAELPAFKSAALLKSKAETQNVASGLFVHRLRPGDTTLKEDMSYWAGEYLSRSWRYVLYETTDKGKSGPELLFFLQHQGGHALTRFAANCFEAKKFAEWIQITKGRR